MSQFRNSLMSLAGAVGNDMDPMTAYNIYQNMLGQHGSQVAARQERIGGLVDYIMEGAQTGLPAEQMQMLLSAQTGGNIPPRVDAAMDTLYPQQVAPPGYGMAATQSPLYQGPSTEEQFNQAQLEGAQLQNQQLEQQMAAESAEAAAIPTVVQMLTDQAMRLTNPSPGVDPATGAPTGQMQPGMTGQQALTLLTQSERFQSLPFSVQQQVYTSIQQAIALKNEKIKARTAAEAQAAAGQQRPNYAVGSPYGGSPSPSLGSIWGVQPTQSPSWLGGM